MINFIIVAVVVAIVILAGLYIRKEKNRGVRCVGCPNAAACSGKCPGCRETCNPDA